MNKREALRIVAHTVMAHTLAASGTGGLFEDEDPAWSDADRDRLGWAVDEVCRRLYVMGRRDA